MSRLPDCPLHGHVSSLPLCCHALVHPAGASTASLGQPYSLGTSNIHNVDLGLPPALQESITIIAQTHGPHLWQPKYLGIPFSICLSYSTVQSSKCSPSSRDSTIISAHFIHVLTPGAKATPCIAHFARMSCWLDCASTIWNVCMCKKPRGIQEVAKQTSTPSRVSIAKAEHSSHALPPPALHTNQSLYGAAPAEPRLLT